MLGSQRAEVVVVGGGIIGLAVAWRLRQRGLDVELLERDGTGEGTSRVAAGMLAPVAEVEFGEAGRRVLDLGLRSAALWPGFAAELCEVSGLELALLRTGTLLLARDEDEARELERQLAFRRSLGLPVERLRASEAREREPALAPTVRLALEAPDDHAVDPRPVLAALRQACLDCGVRLREHAEVASVELDAAGARVAGVTLTDGERIDAAQLVLAAGPWSGRLAGLPQRARVPVRPIRGQILRLRDPAGPGLVRRVVRFEGGYLLPRGDGRYVLGATVEERGFALSATAGGVYELLRDARELVPGVSELEIEELSVGLRPGTPDNAPLIGPGALAGLTWATGHHRNGILLAPLTAQLVADLLAPSGREGEGADARLLATCAPDRFAPPRAADEVLAAAPGGAV
jgi:glycine oxidase